MAIRWLPGGREARRTARARRMPDARRSGRMAGAALRLPLIFVAATIAAGVLDSFLPLAQGIPTNLCSAALLVQAITATLSRWQAGKHGDRYGHARLLIPALAVAALGMAAMMVLGSPVVLFAGMVLFGAGFGVIENATFALLIEQLPEAKASAWWNLAYDAGYGAGPAVFGLICVRTGYAAAFALTGALILAVVPVAWRERKEGCKALPEVSSARSSGALSAALFRCRYRKTALVMRARKNSPESWPLVPHHHPARSSVGIVTPAKVSSASTETPNG